jgi:hypothetical protein
MIGLRKVMATSSPRRILNRCASAVIAACIVPALRRCGFHAARRAQVDWNRDWTFTFRGTSLPYFFHRHNCGWPPLRCTERVVELAVADRWLSQQEGTQVVEVGAVTPYYWPGRVRQVIDPTDPHPAVTKRDSVFDVSLAEQTVLSISTIEHIGLGDYGLSGAQPELAGKALAKIFAETRAFLVSAPVGYNAALDRILFEGDFPGDVQASYLRRVADVAWREETDREAVRLAYGPRGSNGLVILSRGWRLT